MSDVVFALQGVCYSYLGRYPALQQIDLAIRSGEKVAIIGANGTGKSTLLNLLDGLIFPNSGSCMAFGEPLTEAVLTDERLARRFRQRVGFVFQNADIQLFCPSVREDIVFGPLQLGVEKSEVVRRLEEVVQVLDIGHLLDRVPYQLSIGEKRRVAIASVLAIDPEVYLFDEPTAGLDPQTVRNVIDFIERAGRRGKTIITATHDLHIVGEIADRVYVFGRGNTIVRHGAPELVLGDSAFLEQHNLIHLHRHRHDGRQHLHQHRPLEPHD